MNIILTKEVEVKYKINMELNICSLPCCEKIKGFISFVK